MLWELQQGKIQCWIPALESSGNALGIAGRKIPEETLLDASPGELWERSGHCRKEHSSAGPQPWQCPGNVLGIPGRNSQLMLPVFAGSCMSPTAKGTATTARNWRSSDGPGLPPGPPLIPGIPLFLIPRPLLFPGTPLSLGILLSLEVPLSLGTPLFLGVPLFPGAPLFHPLSRENPASKGKPVPRLLPPLWASLLPLSLFPLFPLLLLFLRPLLPHPHPPAAPWIIRP